MKIAQALVVGNDLSQVRYLRHIGGLSEELKPYQVEIQAVEDMYRSIWRLHVFVDEAYAVKRSLVAYPMSQLIEVPNDSLLSEFPDDDIFEPKSVYGLLVNDRSKEFGFAVLPRIVAILDRSTRLRKPNRKPDETALQDLVSQAISEANASASDPQPPLFS